jgi:hypothetical protein
MLSSSRKDSFKKGLAGQRLSSDRLKEMATSIRKEKRSSDFKRFRGQVGDDEGPGGVSGQQQGVSLTETDLRKAIHLVQTNESKAQVLEGMLTLRRFLCNYDDAPIQAIVESGVIRLFISLLSCGDEEIVTEVVWCLTNIATGDHAQTGEVITAAPALLSILDDRTGVFSSTLKEQVCWTIGNVAGDSDLYREALLQSGALQSLSSFLVATMDRLMQQQQQQVADTHSSSGAASSSLSQKSGGDPDSAVALSSSLSQAGTVCWALSNLARGSTTAAAFLSSGVIAPLLGLMQLAEQQRQQQWSGSAGADPAQQASASSMRSLMVEVCWIFVFLSAKEEESVDALLQQGLVEALTSLLCHCTSSTEDAHLAVPALRCIGNIGSGPPQWQQRLLSVGASLLPALAALSDHRTQEAEVAKEALWVVATLYHLVLAPSPATTLASAPVPVPEPAPVPADVQDELVANVMDALVSDKFDLQREAMIACEQACFAADSGNSYCRRSRLLDALAKRADGIRRVVELVRVADVGVNLASVRVLRELAESDGGGCGCKDCRQSGLYTASSSSSSERSGVGSMLGLLRDLRLHEVLDDIQYGPGAPELRAAARDLANDLFECDDDEEDVDVNIYGPGDAGVPAQYEFSFAGPAPSLSFDSSGFGQQDQGRGQGQGQGGYMSAAGGGAGVPSLSAGFDAGASASASQQASGAGPRGMGRGIHTSRPAWMNESSST